MRTIKRGWELDECWMMRVRSRVCSTLMRAVKRGWELGERWMTRVRREFVPLSCVPSNEDESWMSVQWWELDESLFQSHAYRQTRMRVGWVSSSMMRVRSRACSTLMRAVKRGLELGERWMMRVRREFVPLSCVPSNENESWMSVEWWELEVKCVPLSCVPSNEDESWMSV